MINYLIWLKSGGCITGVAEKEILDMLQDRFKEHEGLEKEVVSFSDSEGITYVDLNRIEAVGINELVENNNKMGFN